MNSCSGNQKVLVNTNIYNILQLVTFLLIDLGVHIFAMIYL